MKYYYVRNNEKFGPFELEELKAQNITPETLMWHEGMADWVPAKELTQLSELIAQANTENCPPPPPSINYNTQKQEENSYPPKNYLIESILLTVLCCMPLGVVSIIHAAKVDSLYNAKRYKEAEQASKDAKKWVKYGFISGIVFFSLYILFYVIMFATVWGSSEFFDY